MKNIQNLFLIFLFFFVTSEIFAGLGDTEIGAGGFKRNIEVNEIEEIDESEKQNEAFESDNKF